MYADVLVELSIKDKDQTFTYKTLGKLEVGMRVLVPFKSRLLEGFVLNVHDNEPAYATKEIIKVIDEVPVLNDEMLRLGQYLKTKTMCNLITCYQAMLPKALKAKEGVVVNKKVITYIRIINNDYIAKNKAQQSVIDQLQNGPMVKSGLSAIKTLLKNKVIEEYTEEQYRLNNTTAIKENMILPTIPQQIIIDDISANLDKYYPSLIHGVTGSGKTEIYMNIIDNVLKNGQESIMLVPEISLTPQLTTHFKNRFGNNIAILHSHLNDGERYDEWRKIIRKEVKIVIGARSAIFAPFTNLGIIIIDEEHSNTYKQENNPKYNALDVAMVRAKYHHIPLILGSATPSLETYTRALSGHIKLFELKERINRNMPKVILVDLKEEIKNNHKILSRILIEKINDRLVKGEQVLILLNRRGYSTTINCHNCGYTDKCPMCDVPLVYHKVSNKMQCHYCNFTKNKIDSCPTCKSKDINQFGLGTQKLEEYLNQMFPSANIIRMDQDTTGKKNAHEQIINDFQAHKYDILIGTQMIAKGLDFPNVTLVGVLNGDASLSIPDFKSAERTFQLLNQVSGRSGRGALSGEVIIQAYNIEHYSIKKAVANDYLGFYNEELNIRRILKYSPYYNMCVIKLYSRDYEELNKEANKVAGYLRREIKANTILGPSSPSMPKINNIYSMQIIIKYKNIEEIMESIKFVNGMYIKNKIINLEIDFNPSKI